jgi:hypothetical protein
MLLPFVINVHAGVEAPEGCLGKRRMDEGAIGQQSAEGREEAVIPRNRSK